MCWPLACLECTAWDSGGVETFWRSLFVLWVCHDFHVIVTSESGALYTLFEGDLHAWLCRVYVLALIDLSLRAKR